ncbi:2-oxo acid dehydrogenase subunit E2 [Neomicrococcus lactis]|uniref:Dihydrolipoamide acetyltransferase component of pyruvate dehydrogenase complex n=1 Tax=Neomicrococcus lactis TaxID=732241 RepID=A0A7W8YAR4_9MICC|nr:pyruvate dehydrogenase E2 component (dihydrolipoamide acetyltransferase) [Neomicrococcus lactis]
MLQVFKLPDLGEGLTESELLSWKVAVGDSVQLNQVIAEVETAKAVVELPSPYEGVVADLLAEPGQTVPVGDPIVSFQISSEHDAAAPGSSAASGNAVVEEEEERRQPTLVGYGAEVAQKGRPQRRARATVGAAVGAADSAPQAGGVVVLERPRETVTERPRSTPPVRKFARDSGVNLELVTGTGPAGLITREDVENFIKPSAAPAASPAAATVAATATTVAPSVVTATGVAGARETRTPIKGVRKATAAAMVSSAFTAPHVTEFLTVDVTKTMKLIRSLKENKEFAGVRLGPMTIVAKVVSMGLMRHPELNSRWDEAAGEIVTPNYVNLGIAAATPRGLMVPNIKDAQSMSLRELADALTDLVVTAREGKSSPEQLTQGTFTITNVGVFGVDAGTPIINPGEAAILAMGQVRKQPWAHKGKIKLREVMTLSLSFDHRLVDGEQGSKFLSELGAVLEDPASLMTLV